MCRTPFAIRPETAEDRPAVSRVNQRAFDRADEANLVEALRGSPAVILSLVAVLDGEIAGHALFTTVGLHLPGGTIQTGAALGPIAVDPGSQRRGLGSGLIQQGLAQLGSLGIGFCVVLGHPAYYRRFGFSPASRFGIRCNWPVPDGVFMLQELLPGALKGRHGFVTYALEFDEV